MPASNFTNPPYYNLFFFLFYVSKNEAVGCIDFIIGHWICVKRIVEKNISLPASLPYVYPHHVLLPRYTHPDSRGKGESWWLAIIIDRVNDVVMTLSEWSPLLKFNSFSFHAVYYLLFIYTQRHVECRGDLVYWLDGGRQVRLSIVALVHPLVSTSFPSKHGNRQQRL